MSNNPVTVFQGRVFGAAQASLKATAKRTQQDMRPRIDSRKTPQGGGQRADSPAYAAVKARRLGHTTPLHGKEGILRDPDEYRVVQDGAWCWILYPPARRLNVIQWLRQRGFEWFEVPKEAARWLQDELKARLP